MECSSRSGRAPSLGRPPSPLRRRRRREQVHDRGLGRNHQRPERRIRTTKLSPTRWRSSRQLLADAFGEIVYRQSPAHVGGHVRALGRLRDRGRAQMVDQVLRLVRRGGRVGDHVYTAAFARLSTWARYRLDAGRFERSSEKSVRRGVGGRRLRLLLLRATRRTASGSLLASLSPAAGRARRSAASSICCCCSSAAAAAVELGQVLLVGLRRLARSSPPGGGRGSAPKPWLIAS